MGVSFHWMRWPLCGSPTLTWSERSRGRRAVTFPAQSADRKASQLPDEMLFRGDTWQASERGRRDLTVPDLRHHVDS